MEIATYFRTWRVLQIEKLYVGHIEVSNVSGNRSFVIQII